MAFNRLMLSVLLIYATSLIGQYECGQIEITPNKTSVNPGEDVVIRISVPSCLELEASQINSIKLHEQGNVLASVTLYNGINGSHVNATEQMPKRIKVEGRIDNENKTSSYLSVTFTKPSVKRTGTYVSTIAYTDRDGAVQTSVITASLDVEATTACLSPWIFYNGVCYLEMSSSLNWRIALGECHRPGGDLAKIENQDTNDYLQYDFPWKNKDGHWFGLNDQWTENTFIWNWTRNSKVTYFNWASGKTGSYGWLDCVQFDPKTGKWAEGDCWSRKKFLCAATPAELIERKNNPLDEDALS